MDSQDAKVIDLQAFRTRRTLVGERKSGVQQAFNPLAQPSSRSQQSSEGRPAEADLSTRIERIKSSIARINQLMQELRSPTLDGKSPPKS